MLQTILTAGLLAIILTIVGVLLYLASIIACPIIADRKFRCAEAWFILGILFGPLSLLVVLCLN